MGGVRRVGSAASVVLLAGLLVGCGSETASPDGASAPESTASDSAGPEGGPVLQDPNRRLVRCLHSSTVPAEGDTTLAAPSPAPSPAPSLPDSSREIDPHFWLPFYVECPTAELDQEPAS